MGIFFVTKPCFLRHIWESEVSEVAEFQEVYDRYFRDVYKYALSLSRDPDVAEEITQETFFKALKNIDSFRGQCRLYVWLCQIAKNTYLTQLQKQSRASPEVEVPSGESLEDRLLTRESATACAARSAKHWWKNT